MGKRIDEFCEDLRLKLTNIENGMNSLKAKAEGKAEQAEKDVRSHLAAVQKRIAQDEAKASKARAEIKAWLDQKKTATAEKIAEWKAKAETAHLNIVRTWRSVTLRLPLPWRWRRSTKPSRQHWKLGSRVRTRLLAGPNKPVVEARRKRR